MDRRQEARRHHRRRLRSRSAGQRADRAPEGPRRGQGAAARGHHRERGVYPAPRARSALAARAFVRLQSCGISSRHSIRLPENPPADALKSMVGSILGVGSVDVTTSTTGLPSMKRTFTPTMGESYLPEAIPEVVTAPPVL